LLLRSRCDGWAIAGDAGRGENQISVAAATCGKRLAVGPGSAIIKTGQEGRYVTRFVRSA
jgi:hypothetical protein